MINFVIGTNLLRALVTDSAGVSANDAVVIATMIKKYGAAVPEITNAAMTLVIGQSAYNYEFVTPNTFNPVLGTLYEVTLVVTRNGQTRTRAFVANVSNS